ncbi:MAG: alpha/beta hydrolase [Myxococcota bacterium]|nr:alpha/beta hydrolase [Myxococcota bacterium]
MRRRRALVLTVVFVLSAPIVIPFLSRSLTDSMLFHPERGQSRTPAALGLGYSELGLQTEDGITIQAWWIPFRGDPAVDRNLAVVTFHGNAGTLADRLEHTRLLHDLGVSTLAVEYRGYGDSEGSPSEDGLALDARAGLAEARRRIGGGKVLVHGRSLGGAVAIGLAADQPVDGLMVESTFTSLGEMAGHTGIPLASRLVAYRFASEEGIARVQAPVLVVQGRQDELIPVAMGERLRDAAPDADWFEVSDGRHNDTWLRGGADYWSAVAAWLGRCGG